jgi:hypothetical protein
VHDLALADRDFGGLLIAALDHKAASRCLRGRAILSMSGERQEREQRSHRACQRTAHGMPRISNP